MSTDTNPLSKQNSSLLLYLETCAVDHGGKIDATKVNEAELRVLEAWNRSGFVRFGRMTIRKREQCQGGRDYAYWCVLSQPAWAAAHAEREARARRNMDDEAKAGAA